MDEKVINNKYILQLQGKLKFIRGRKIIRRTVQKQCLQTSFRRLEKLTNNESKMQNHPG